MRSEHSEQENSRKSTNNPNKSMNFVSIMGSRSFEEDYDTSYIVP